MPTIRPFRGIRYNQSKVDISRVVAPPYDVISPEQQAQLYDRDPHNVVRLILGREADRYGAAADAFSRWLESEVLVRDAQPAVYVLAQTFKALNGATVKRKGFIALCRLEEFEKGIILPHEKTLSKAKEDRFKLFKATNANFSQIFGLYSDSEKKVDRFVDPICTSRPTVEVEFDHVLNQLWSLSEPGVVDQIATEMEKRQVLIADGHHRYETALAYRELMKSQNPQHSGSELYNYVMMFFTNLDDEGLVIFPTHRVIHSFLGFSWEDFTQKIHNHFKLTEYTSRQDMIRSLGSYTRHAYGIICGRPPRYWIASLHLPSDLDSLIPTVPISELKDLDVVLLHSYLLGTVLGISSEAQEKKLNIHYVQDVEDCEKEVAEGTAQLAFIVNPTRIEQVRAVARAGHTMPQKSTFFYPKLLSGLVLNKMAG